jgi:aminopeptidase N
MHRIFHIRCWVVGLLGVLACWGAHTATAQSLPVKGVSYLLAQQRARQLHEVEYRLAIEVPVSADSLAVGHADVSFRLDRPEQVVMDFYDATYINKVYVHESTSATQPWAVNEHIVVPAESMHAGENTVHVDFSIPPRLLNHRGNLVYTLSVPDKARRLFPCFDQPDLKATYHLTLTLPAGWQALSNGAVLDCRTEGPRTTIQFAPTEPLSTYLFAFAAGQFQRVEMTRGGRTIALYHCETDPALTSQCDDILREVFASLEWQERYTGIPYPFAKYDLALIPGFQFGGMEHTGATLYNDRLLFLPPQATLDERLARSALIAHETSHMWFGDYVTMRWFGEVWTKEVFANYYAAAITEPLYPEVDHRLRFMLAYAPVAYAEDRTLGANPIQQQLDNLQDAGLVYGNIIYNKSPMMMRQLVQKVGEDAFRDGIRRYLSHHAYGNATWEGLIEALDSLSREDLTAWSQSWVHEAGMPEYTLSRKGRTLILRQDGVVRPQRITFSVDDQPMTADCRRTVTKLRLPARAEVILPNADGMAYGYFRMDSTMLHAAWSQLSQADDLSRGALLINLHEALWRGDIPPKEYARRLTEYLPRERNPLLYSLLIGHLRTAHTRFVESPDEMLERTLWQIVKEDTVPPRKITALRALADVMDTPQAVQRVLGLWKGELTIPGFQLSDRDAMSLTYQLAVRLPQQADSLVAEQRRRLVSPNLQKEFDFIAPAVSPRPAERDSVFAALLTVEGRRVEPWAESALSLLNHRYRRAESQKYLMPGLEVLEEVKRTGDIFFPKRWVASLVSGHRLDTVRRIVDEFLAARPDYPLMLKRKIWMNVWEKCTLE